MKICHRCRKELPTDAFYKNRTSKDGLQRWCKDCARPEKMKWWASRPLVKGREYNLRTRYGISIEEYTSLLEAQTGRCAVCNTDSPGGNGGFQVDHNHETGSVRGLLCCKCNRGIGNLQDSPEVCARAAEYLSRAPTCLPSLIPQIVPIGLRSSSPSTAAS